MEKKTREEQVLLTPELAKELLSKNYTLNRRIRDQVVSRYANDMTNGLWSTDYDVYSIDPIIISAENSEMINGQHRCMAVIRSGVSVPCVIKYNVPEKVYEYLDGGESRKLSDFLQTEAKNIAALSRVVYAIEDGSAPLKSALTGRTESAKNGGAVPSRTMVLKKIEENHEFFLRLISLGRKVYTRTRISPSRAAIALFILIYTDNGDCIERWVDDIDKDVSSKSCNILFKDYVLKLRIDAAKRSVPISTDVSSILYAYDHFVADDILKSFNKTALTFSKYDKLVAAKRESKRTKEGATE